MKKEWLMASLSILLTLAIALLLIRSLAPRLLGIPVDLQMVGVSEEVPPFFENVFRTEDLLSPEFIIKDPYVGVRAQPLFPNQESMGPNDILGFRNHGVPNVADIVVIGDSQTYGNNSPIQLNWPSQMAAILDKQQKTTVYNMSVGGWGAVQYLYAALNATVFQPRILVVAFYTGNDPLDSFKMAYNYDIWNELIPDPALDASDIPKVVFPPPESELWTVTFSDGVSTILSPKLRFASNMDHPAVRAGYAIMAEVAKRIVAMTYPKGIQVAFTIIPTKELVHAKKVIADNIMPEQEYEDLVAAENANIELLKRKILDIEHATYVDVLTPLQDAALEPMPLYPQDSNGHPNSRGYEVIADTVARAIQPMVKDRPQGFALIRVGDNQHRPVLITRHGYWYFADRSDNSLIEGNGWSIQDAPIITQREIADMEYAGLISDVQPEKYGPKNY
jgi:lysophospholipase L1-like esterase